jgi:cytochrome c553
MREPMWSLPALACLTGIIGIQSAALGDPATDFMLHCMGCHGANAQGVPGKVPPLAQSLGEFMRSPAGRNYVLRVPGAANSMLSDERLAAVLNWIAARFSGGEAVAAVRQFTPQEVTAARHFPLVSVQVARRQVVQELAASGPAPASDY